MSSENISRCLKCGHDKNKHFHNKENHSFDYCMLRGCGCYCFISENTDADITILSKEVLKNIYDEETKTDFRQNCLCRILKRMKQHDERSIIISINKLVELKFLSRLEAGKIPNDTGIGDDPVFVMTDAGKEFIKINI